MVKRKPLRKYRHPNGHIVQYREGNQPDGFTLVEPEKAETADVAEKAVKPASKARTARNKARTSATK